MSNCFQLLGLDESATKAEVQDAYERKTAFYEETTFSDDPVYAKKKLSELQQAYTEAYCLAESTFKEKEDNFECILDQDERYMQKLYRKHLAERLNRLAGIPSKGRSAGDKKTDAAYKRSVLLFWLAVLAGIVGLGVLFT